jgi:hypothetical protein
MTRSEHLAWCKQRALAYLEPKFNDAKGALASFISDMRKHEETSDHIIFQLAPMLMLSGALSTTKEVKDFIESTN